MKNTFIKNNKNIKNINKNNIASYAIAYNEEAEKYIGLLF